MNEKLSIFWYNFRVWFSLLMHFTLTILAMIAITNGNWLAGVLGVFIFMPLSYTTKSGRTIWFAPWGPWLVAKFEKLGRSDES